MPSEPWSTEFEASRSRLESVAYRMLGSHAEAEDAVQDAWLRLHSTDAARIDNLGGWLTTVVARICLDRLRTRQSRREHPLPNEPMVASDGPDPAREAVLAEGIGAAMLVVLDSLTPAERVAFVLHDVFAIPFEEVGAVLDRTPESARQLASRARRRVQATTPAGVSDPLRQREVVDAFLRAARGGDFDGLVRLLHPEVELRPDTAASGMGSFTRTVGATAVATLLSGGARAARLATVDGLTGFVWAPDGHVRGVVELTVVDGRITTLDVTADPARISALEIVLLDA